MTDVTMWRFLRRSAIATTVSILAISLAWERLAIAGPQNWEIKREATTCDADFGCYPSPPADEPPSSCGEECIPDLYPHVSMSGRITDGLGHPISDAKVYWKYGTVRTGSDGTYQITVWTGEVTLIATHENFVFDFKKLDSPILQSTVDFSLKYRHSPIVSPQAFVNSPPKSLTFSVVTPALVSGVALWLQLPDTSVLEYVYAGPHGTGSRWNLAWEVPASFSDGKYPYKSCMVAQDSAGSCDSLDSGSYLSWTVVDYFIADSQSPLVSRSSPAPFDVVPILDSVSIGWNDRGFAGIDPTSLNIWIDGAKKEGSVYGSTIDAPTAGLGFGIHQVRAEAKDLAGNAAQTSFLFTLAEVAGSATTATVLEQSTTVQMNGFSPPSSVYFTPQIIFGASMETLTASTWAGHGFLGRQFDVGPLSVVFTNAAGATATATATYWWLIESHEVGVLAPSAGPMEAHIPEHQFDLPDLEVTIPTGFNTTGTVAVLQKKHTEIAAYSSSRASFFWSPLFESMWRGPVTLRGTLGLCFTGTGADNELNMGPNCRADSGAGLRAGNEQTLPIPVFRPIDPELDPYSTTETVAPACDGCFGSSYWRNGQTSFGTGCPTITLDSELGPTNLCTGDSTPASKGPWSLYQNAWIYKATSPTNGGTWYPVWQQNRTEGRTTTCSNDRTGSIKGWTYRFTTNALATDGTSSPITGQTFYDSLNPTITEQSIYLGRDTGNSLGKTSTSAEYQISSASNSDVLLRTEGRYLRSVTGPIDSLGGTPNTSQAATSNGWEFDSSPEPLGPYGISESLQIYTGTDFRTRPVQQQTYGIDATVSFIAVIDFACS